MSNKRSREEKAIEAIKIASKFFGVPIDVRYNFGRTVARYTRKWVVKVQGKVFYNDIFPEAVKAAVLWMTDNLPEYKENSRLTFKY